MKDLRTSAGPQQILFRTDPIKVEPDRVVAAGIVVTELVLNALKHAYPGGTGPVRIALSRRSGAFVDLSAEDDGIGHAGDRAARQGLGKTIVRAMAEKLDAALHHDGKHRGTRVILHFRAG